MPFIINALAALEIKTFLKKERMMRGFLLLWQQAEQPMCGVGGTVLKEPLKHSQWVEVW